MRHDDVSAYRVPLQCPLHILHVHWAESNGIVIAMFWPDILTYRQFYASALGKTARRTVRSHINSLWPDATNETVLALGYAVPYMRELSATARRTIMAMPAGQGVMHWPDKAHNSSLLIDESDIPLPNDSVHKIILVHMLEHSYVPHHMMQECWRVLQPEGQLLVLAPNRRGIWSRFDNTPLGQGRPFSAPQMREILSQHRFSCIDAGGLLFYPPLSWRLLLRASNTLEKIGRFCASPFGGMQWMLAEKHIYALPRNGHPARVKKLTPAYFPAPVASSRDMKDL